LHRRIHRNCLRRSSHWRDPLRLHGQRLPNTGGFNRIHRWHLPDNDWSTRRIVARTCRNISDAAHHRIIECLAKHGSHTAHTSLFILLLLLFVDHVQPSLCQGGAALVTLYGSSATCSPTSGNYDSYSVQAGVCSRLGATGSFIVTCNDGVAGAAHGPASSSVAFMISALTALFAAARMTL